MNRKLNLLILLISFFNISTASNKYDDYYCYQRLDLDIYNNSYDCNYSYENDAFIEKSLSFYYFNNCNCDMDSCAYKVLDSYKFLTTNYSYQNYNISECIKKNYQKIGNTCIVCKSINNTLPNIYLDTELLLYNNYCLLSKFIMGILIFTIIIILIIFIVKKNEKKIIIYKKKRTYTRV